MILFIIFIVNTVLGLGSIASKSFLLERIHPESVANSTELRNFDNFYYAVNIDVGTPKQNRDYKYLLTQDQILWVANLTCKGCNIKRRYDPNLSSTYVDYDESHQQQYGQGQCSGTFGEDLFYIPGTAMNTTLEFLLVNNESDLNLALATSGLMGLSNWNAYQNIFEVSYEENQISSPLFGFALSNQLETSMLLYGDWNQTALDQTTWIQTNMEKKWSLKTLGVEINDEDFYYFKDHSSIFDSGTSCLALQEDFYQYLYDNYLNCDQDCDCNQQYPTLTFYFEGAKVSVPDTEYKQKLANGSCAMCLQIANSYNVLGDPFMRQIIAIFDKKNQQIGIYQPQTLMQINIGLVSVAMLVFQSTFVILMILYCFKQIQ